MNNDLKKAALWYAGQGWPVFPCRPGEKVPATAHGVKDATTDLKQIDRWWLENLNYNIAFACGGEKGIYVVDVDVDSEKGIDGYGSMTEFPKMPATVLQMTPRGGCHAFFTTADPPANKNNFRKGVDIRGDGYYVMLTPSVHPNGKKYEWAPGSAPAECKMASYPSFMRPKKKEPTYKGIPVVYKTPLSLYDKDRDGEKETYITGVLTDADKISRATQYLQELDPAIQGSGGHDSLLWAAGCLVNGFLLSLNDTYALLSREYNPRCMPPWDLADEKDSKDFKRKISEAKRIGSKNAPGWLLNEPIEIGKSLPNMDDVSKSVDIMIENHKNANIGVLSIAAKSSPAVKSRADKLSMPQSEEVSFLTSPVGKLGEFCSWLNKTSRRQQPLFSLGCTLAFFGALFGRKVRDIGNGRTNIYCMGTGESSAGKNHAQVAIRDLAHEAGLDHLIGGDDWASDSGIETCLSGEPSTVFLLDEIGHLFCNLKKANAHYVQKIIPQLMKLYSSSSSVYKGREYADKDKQKIIVQPCLSIWGTSIPERFAEGISPDELIDGWLSRCLVFNSRFTPRKVKGYEYSAPPTELLEWTRSWGSRTFMPPADQIKASDIVTIQGGMAIETAPQQMLVPTTDAAHAVFYAFDDESEVIGDGAGVTKCLWRKAEENARRVALIVATANDYWSPVITEEIADYSCRLIRFLLRDFCATMLGKISGSEIESKKQKLLAKIASCGEFGCSKTALAKSSQTINSRERMLLVSDLIEGGYVKQGPKNKSHYFWTTENYQGGK